MFGIKALKKVFLALVGLRLIVGEVFENGKIDFADIGALLSLGEEYKNLKPILTQEGKVQLRNEFNDLSEAEKKELIAEIAEKLNLPNVTEEILTERLLEWAIETADLVNDTRRFFIDKTTTIE